MSFIIDKEILITSCKNLLSSAIYVEIANDFEFERILKEENLQDKIKSFDSFKEWKRNELNPQIFNNFAIDWIFLCDLLNFSFWKDEDDNNFDVEFNGKIYKNYWSLPATLNKNSPVLIDPKFYFKMTIEQFDEIFNPNIPLKGERVRLMNEAGKVLIEKYEGSFSNFFKKFNSNGCWNFINRVIEDFPSFRDFHEKSSTWFLKRAQILVADLWAASEGRLFNDSVGELTIFADYRYFQFLHLHEINQF